MDQFYYLVSSLPALSPESGQFPSSAGFLASCSDWMDENALALVVAARIAWDDDAPSHPVIDAWHAWDRGLRNALSMARAARKQADGSTWLRRDAAGDNGILQSPVQEIARAATAAATPLDAEGVLFKGRWSRLDEMELGHYFDLSRLMVYHLKLQLLEKWKGFDPEKGAEGYKARYETVNASFPLDLDA